MKELSYTPGHMNKAKTEGKLCSQSSGFDPNWSSHHKITCRSHGKLYPLILSGSLDAFRMVSFFWETFFQKKSDFFKIKAAQLATSAGIGNGRPKNTFKHEKLKNSIKEKKKKFSLKKYVRTPG